MWNERSKWWILLGVAVCLSGDYSVEAASRFGHVEVIAVPKSYIFADGSPTNSKPKGKLKLILDAGIRTIGAEIDGYRMETRNVDVEAGKKHTVIMALLKNGLNRDQMQSIGGGTVSIGLTRDRLKWMVKRLGTRSSNFSNAIPAHEVKLNRFKIDRFEVTNNQYRKFVTAAKRTPPKHWRGGKVSIEIAEYPVVNVSHATAAAYCKWKGKRLPREAEWEYAARGDLKHTYPWGKKFRQGRANLKPGGYSHPTETGRYEKGVGKSSGCYDLSGNVWEWTDSWYDAYPGSSHKDKDFGKTKKVIRGGSFRENRDRIASAYRGRLKPDLIRDDVGFRCVK